jgi:small ubiquitin-related modifier
MFFKIKKTTKMSKVFETYAKRKGLQPTSLRFLLDGGKVKDDDTPKLLELEDQDQIDCVMEQVRKNYVADRRVYINLPLLSCFGV